MSPLPTAISCTDGKPGPSEPDRPVNKHSHPVTKHENCNKFHITRAQSLHLTILMLCYVLGDSKSFAQKHVIFFTTTTTIVKSVLWINAIKQIYVTIKRRLWSSNKLFFLRQSFKHHYKFIIKHKWKIIQQLNQTQRTSQDKQHT